MIRGQWALMAPTRPIHRAEQAACGGLETARGQLPYLGT